MTNHKLFKVLVIGGALMGAACDEPTPTRDAGDPPSSDAAPGGDSAVATSDGGDATVRSDATVPSDGATAQADAGELMECGFCPNEHCCVTDDSGESHAREGMVCCWGTSC